MDPITWLIIALAVGALGTGANAYMTYKTNETNKDLAAQAQEFEKEQWEASNLYNSPVNQMTRLQQAGLNPMLVYGSGNVTGNTSAAPVKATLPNITAPQIDTGSLVNAMAQVSSIQRNDAQTDLIEQQTANAKLDALLKSASEYGMRLSNTEKENLLLYQKDNLFWDLQNKHLNAMNQELNWRLGENRSDMEILDYLNKRDTQGLRLSNAQMETALKELQLNEEKQLETIKSYGPYAQLLMQFLKQ